jgi:hypothetical protein
LALNLFFDNHTANVVNLALKVLAHSQVDTSDEALDIVVISLTNHWHDDPYRFRREPAHQKNTGLPFFSWKLFL